MATPFRLKRSSVQGKRPALADLQTGELALNTNDGFLFATRDTGGVGIGTTVTLLTPWTENFGGGSIFYANSVGIGTTNPTSALTVTGTGASISQLFVTGVSTFVGVATFPNSNVFINNSLFVGGVQINGGASIGTDVTTRNLNVSGIGTIATLGVTGVTTTQHLNVIGVSTLGFATATQLFVSGVTTSTGGFVGNLTGVASSATKLVTPRTFEITGDVVASAISFDGTGNVSLAATIQPNSVALGGDTTGDYVQTITGTANQITVTGGTGESSTPTLSIPNQFTVPQDLTVIRDVQINRNLNVNGNITIGGTSATLFTTELKISDPDLILGFRTDALGNDISNDTTANHGGIAVASTEGSPLVNLFIAGIETTPATYKKIMWFKSGEFAGLGTDAWLSNYAVGIGSTQFPTGTRLAAGNVQFTQNDLAVVRNINSTGVITATGGIQGIGIQSGSVNIATGIITALNFVGSGNTFSYNSITKTVDINIGGSQWSFTDTSNTLTSNIFRLNGNVGLGTTNPTSKLHVVGDTLITGVLTATNGIRGIGIQSGGASITTGIITTLNFVGTAVSTVTNTNGLVEINVKGGEFTKSVTSIASTAGQTSFPVTYTPNFIDVFLNGVRLTSSEFTATNGTSVVLNEATNDGDTLDVVVFQNSGLFDGSKWIAATPSTPSSGDIYRISGNIGIGTTNPQAKLHVIGNTIFTGVGVATTSVNSVLQLGKTNIYYVGVTSLTLPPSPSVGDRLEIINRSGITTAILLNNGSAIMGVVDDMQLDVVDGAFTLTYSNVTDGWVVGR